MLMLNYVGAVAFVVVLEVFIADIWTMSCFFCRNHFFAVIFFLSLTSFCVAQAFSPSAMDNDVLDGIWENDSHIVAFSEGDNGSMQTDIVLKTFYGFYYDGIYKPHESLDEINFARIDDGLYMQYWVSTLAYIALGTQVDAEENIQAIAGEGDEIAIDVTMVESDKSSDDFFDTESVLASGIFWRPAGNRREFTIDTVPIQTEVLSYYIDEQHIYKVRYWLTTAEFTDEKAELTLKTVKNTSLLQGGLNNLETEPKIVYIDKYIQIGESVYTCATGLRTLIRNVTTIETLPGTPTITEDVAIMVLDAPYLVLSDITNLEAAIEEHNSIIYPPRDGRARFVEPSIYEKLRSMRIGDFTIEEGESF